MSSHYSSSSKDLLSARDLLVAAPDPIAAAVLRHRQDGRLADASVELERWVASCRRQTPAFFITAGGGVATEPQLHSTPTRTGLMRGAMSTKFLAAARSSRSFQSSGDLEEDGSSGASSAATEKLRERSPELRRLFDPEQLLFVVQVRKTNAVGKVQTRLLAITNDAVYNTGFDGRKIKRRIPLAALSLVTASEHTGQFILHVPSEYDYLVNAQTRGYSVLEDAVPPGSPLAGIIGALQHAYAQHVARTPNLAGAQAHLPVRTFSDAGPLAALVKKKSGGGTTRFSSDGGGDDSPHARFAPSHAIEDDEDDRMVY